VVDNSAARWYFVKPILIWVNFGLSCNGRCCGIFYGHFLYFTAKWYILWPFGAYFDRLVYFSRFGMLYVPRKIWQPWLTMYFAKKGAKFCVDDFKPLTNYFEAFDEKGKK
jgi:hypothetical protein